MNEFNNNGLRVTISREKILAALNENRQKHLEDYEKAVKVYFMDIINISKEFVLNAEKKNLEVDYNIKLSKPIFNGKLYDEMISMFQTCIDETFTLSFSEYKNIFQDSWEWNTGAKYLNATYSSRFNR